jgi:hypothetical protein
MEGIICDLRSFNAISRVWWRSSLQRTSGHERLGAKSAANRVDRPLAAERA